MSDNEKLLAQIVAIGAVIYAGPRAEKKLTKKQIENGEKPKLESFKEYNARVGRAAAELSIMVGNDKSPAMWFAKHMLAPMGEGAKRKIITGVVQSVSKETKTGRGVVTLKTKANKNNEKGVDQFRTEHIDGRYGGLEMAKWFSEHKGRLVRAHVALQETGNPIRPHARVVMYAEDLGEPKDDWDK